MDKQSDSPIESPAAKEKIREFCYELALALRRITGKVVENDLAFLEEPLDKLSAQPGGTEEKQEDQKVSD